MTTNWATLLAALAGGLLGGGIPGVMTYLGWQREQRQGRQARRWQDAEVVADAKHLLVDIDPERRGGNANTAPGAEDELWASLNSRRDKVRRDLMVIAAGHSSSEVRSLAGRLEVELFNAAVQSEWHVADVLKKRENPEHLARAVETRQIAVASCTELERAVQSAGA